MLPFPLLHRISLDAWRPGRLHSQGHSPSRPLPGGERHHALSIALPTAARHQPSSVMAVAPTHVGPWPKPGFARPGIASSSPLHCMAPAEQPDGSGSHTRGRRPEPGFARRGAALCPPIRCPAPPEQRDGQGTHTRGASAQPGLGPAGSGILPPLPLPRTSRAA